MIRPLLLVCFLFSSGVCAQIVAQDEVLPVPVPFTGYHTPLQAHRLIGAFWRTDHTFVSTLTIKNIVEIASVEVTPTLTLADGTSYALAPILLPPSGVATVNINNALAQLALGDAPSYGTIGLSYSWHWQGAITGEVQEVDSDRSLSYTSGLGPDATSGSAVVQTIEGLWWKRTAETGGFLRLSNVTQNPIVVSENFFAGDPAAAAVQTQTLAPGQTVMLPLKEILDSVAGGVAEGGLRISYTGQVHGIALDGGLEDESIGFSARLKLGPVAMQGSAAPSPKPISLSSVGLMVGHPDADMMFPRQIVFHPYLIVRNTTGGQRTIAVAANYQLGTAAMTLPLLSVTLAPYATQRIDVESAILALGLNPLVGYVNLVYSFTGASPDLLVSAGSIDGAGNYVFEAPAAPNTRSMARTICYWQAGDGLDTMFTIYNYSDAAEDLTLTFHFDGGSFKLPIHLDAGASTMMGIEDIMARQTPDADGKTIPPGTTEGSANLSGSRGELQHITASVSVASYNPSRATCNVHCIDCATTLYTSFAPTPAFLSLKVSKTQQMVIIGRTRGGTQYNATAAGTWTASNPKVATVGTGASQPGLVTAQAIGAASVSYESPPIQLLLRTCGDPPECPSGEPVTIDVPTDVAQLSCTSVTRGANTTCTGTGPTGTTWTGWQFTDGTNTVSAASGSTATTWSGTAVTSGTITGTATFSDGSTTSYSATLTVSPRTGWAFTAVQPVRQPQGYSCNAVSVPNPPQPSPSQIGLSCVALAYNGSAEAIQDGGPNSGYGYLASVTDGTTYSWTIAQDADTPSSTFYRAQCGNYSASKPSGFISGVTLDADLKRHESGSLSSHYANYSSALLVPADNFGTQSEPLTVYGGASLVGTALQDLAIQVSAALLAASAVEPCGTSNVDYNAACGFDGHINFAPYAACP